jgi:SAM-dependent methyltransferase
MDDARFTADDHYFHGDYLTAQRANDDAAEALAHCDLAPGGLILDGGCGDGRLALRLAALGYRVTAVDHDAAQLQRLNDQMTDGADTLTVIEASLESFVAPEPFDAALLWFTTWGFLSDSANHAVLKSMRNALIPGGVLVIDTLNPVAVERYVAVHPEPVVTIRGGNRQVDRYSFDRSTRRLTDVRDVSLHGSTSTRTLSLSLPSREEWTTNLSDVGLELANVAARRGKEFTTDSWEMVLIARRID